VIPVSATAGRLPDPAGAVICRQPERGQDDPAFAGVCPAGDRIRQPGGSRWRAISSPLVDDDGNHALTPHPPRPRIAEWRTQATNGRRYATNGDHPATGGDEQQRFHM
jgi:hypothetical protein